MILDLELQIEERRRRLKLRRLTWCFRLTLLAAIGFLAAAMFIPFVEGCLFLSALAVGGVVLSYKKLTQLRDLWELK